MRKCRNKKTFWLNDDDDNTLKEMKSISGKSEVDIIRKLIRGTQIKEKPSEEFYDYLNQLVELRKELKKVRDGTRYETEIDTKKLNKLIKEIEYLRKTILDMYLK